MDEPAFRPKRLTQRRLTRACHDCGAILIWLDNPKGPVAGEKWSRWVMIEAYGTKDGVLMPWDGSIVFRADKHVKHVCVRDRRRIGWLIRNKADYDL
jgi:hypothetical protein